MKNQDKKNVFAKLFYYTMLLVGVCVAVPGIVGAVIAGGYRLTYDSITTAGSKPKTDTKGSGYEDYVG